MDLETFRRDGALRLRALFGADEVDALRDLEVDRPGVRLQSRRLASLIRPATAAASALLGEQAHPVRAVLFDKTAQTNWALGWHQDRTIVVRERRDVPGFGPWTRKQSQLHVTPPIAVLETMATLRIHLDPCGSDNAPLKVALGTHGLGLIGARGAATQAGQHEIIDCLADVGDVWAYSTLILHASERASAPRRRRVLQVDYAAGELPAGLAWAGIG